MVPARGGSKSIPKKNLSLLAGVPLLDYGVRAAQAAGCFSRIVCSTDDQEIADHASRLGIEVDRRTAELASDEARVADVAREFLGRAPEGQRPDVLALVQPTSPFLLPEHCRDLMEMIGRDPGANSAQTVTAVVHNHHALNQRILGGPYVSFRYRDERAQAYNKQRKVPHFVFGNLVAARTAALLDGLDFFAEPSVALVIPRHYDLDVDSFSDLEIADALVRAATVKLPHMRSTGPCLRQSAAPLR
jgi:CMP-N,N'-diacetyllegionaminic acid synthase